MAKTMFGVVQLGFRHSLLRQIMERGPLEVQRILCNLRVSGIDRAVAAVPMIASLRWEEINDSHFEHLNCHGPAWIAHMLGRRGPPLREALPIIAAHFNFHCGTRYKTGFVLKILKYLHKIQVYREYSETELAAESKEKHNRVATALLAPQPLVLQFLSDEMPTVSICIPDDETDETFEDDVPRKRGADGDESGNKRRIVSYEEAARQIASLYAPPTTAPTPTVAAPAAAPAAAAHVAAQATPAASPQTATSLTKNILLSKNTHFTYPNTMQRIAAGQTIRITHLWAFAAFAASCFTIGDYVAVPRIAQAVVGFTGVDRSFVVGSSNYGVMRPGPFALVPPDRVRCFGPFVSVETIADCTMMLVPE